MSFITLYTGLGSKLLPDFIGPNKSNSSWIVSIYRVLGSVYISILTLTLRISCYLQMRKVRLKETK